MWFLIATTLFMLSDHTPIVNAKVLRGFDNYVSCDKAIETLLDGHDSEQHMTTYNCVLPLPNSTETPQSSYTDPDVLEEPVLKQVRR